MRQGMGGTKKGCALIQIGVANSILLYHIGNQMLKMQRIKKQQFQENDIYTLPQNLKFILENENILKVGVDLQQDLKLIEIYHYTKMKSVIELEQVVRTVLVNQIVPQNQQKQKKKKKGPNKPYPPASQQVQKLGLSRMSVQILGQMIDKAKGISAGD